ncbi:hydroxyacylglutathione hydrolase [Microbulbifer sp. OS29]|uniref:Hydroxyacylglutathione hydrolase n=1 Tax=Microbulbifer okhotskensis TaxID=2926617 RepID=A0A9X2EKE8_9GAMM|nr:hydroxyacylglutathione hydrolase [Microbulbifer okhotskensis]MCO1333296.1 hydroxyacylglutathione hydrolase [Microbulbifer okhotskensis]
MLSITPIPAFNDNYIWHLQEGGQHWVVDPGDFTPVERALKGKKLSGILITHHHLDHTGGIDALYQRYQCPVYGPRGIAGITHPLADGDSVKVLGMSLTVQAVPGHTLDHLAFVLNETTASTEEQLHLFCGDTLFAAGCGRLFEGTPEQMYLSLLKLSKLPPSTHVYCTHEYTLANLRFAQTVEATNPIIAERIAHCEKLRADNKATLPSTIGLELDSNPFLRCHLPQIAKSVAAHGAHSKQQRDSAVNVFAGLRGWKDQC